MKKAKRIAEQIEEALEYGKFSEIPAEHFDREFGVSDTHEDAWQETIDTDKEQHEVCMTDEQIYQENNGEYYDE